MSMKRDMVAGLIIREKKLLLVHNTKHNGLRIEPPGGKKNQDESWEEATTRELKEELDIEVRVGKLLGVYDTNSPEGEFSVRMYFCEIISGESKLMEPEKISKFNWYSYDEIAKLAESGVLVPNMKLALADLKPYLF